MRRLTNWTVLLLLILACAGCAGFAEFFGGAAAVVGDPEVQKHAGGVAANLAVGNYWGAATSLGELVFAGAAVYKATMMRREALRAGRGEPTISAPDLPVA